MLRLILGVATALMVSFSMLSLAQAGLAISCVDGQGCVAVPTGRQQGMSGYVDEYDDWMDYMEQYEDYDDYADGSDDNNSEEDSIIAELAGVLIGTVLPEGFHSLSQDKKMELIKKAVESGKINAHNKAALNTIMQKLVPKLSPTNMRIAQNIAQRMAMAGFANPALLTAISIGMISYGLGTYVYNNSEWIQYGGLDGVFDFIGLDQDPEWYLEPEPEPEWQRTDTREQLR